MNAIANPHQFHASRREDIFFPVVERPVYWKGKDDTYYATDYKQLVRADKSTPIPLSIVHNDYKVVTNREILAVVNEATSNRNVEIETYMDYSGRKCYIDVIFNDVVHAFSGENTAYRTIFWNGYGGTSFGVKLGAINFFCLNGCIMGEHESLWKRHTKGLDVNVVREWITDGENKYSGRVKKWAQWQATVPQVESYNPFWQMMSENEKHIHMMGDKHSKVYLPQYGDNFFSIYQTLTDFASHNDNYKLRNVTNQAPHQKELDLLMRAERVMERIAA